MTPIEIVASLSSKGVRLEYEDGVLVVDAPEGIVDESMWQALAEQKPVIIPFLAHGWEVGWRAAAMLPQIPETGPIPFLIARKLTKSDSESCHSCGEAIGTNEGYVCGNCNRAKHLALDLVMRFTELNQS